jgi:serine/threonine protein kinase
VAKIGSTDLMLETAHHTWTVLSGRVEAFIHAWEHAAEPPSPRDFLPAGPPTVRCLTLVELLKVDLEYRWIHRKTPRTIEEYCTDYADLAHDFPADLIYEEYHVRRQAGDPVAPEDYFARFPERAAELRRLFGLNPVEQSTSLCRGIGPQLANLQQGERLDDFDLLVLLGKGAFASVFLARQNSMQRLVALKVSADKGHEPQTLAQLDHEHIVRVFDQRVLPDRKLRLLYMQYVPGGTLQGVVEIVRRTPPPERTGMMLVAGIEEALARRGETLPGDSALKARLAHRPWPEVVCSMGAKLARALDHAHRHGVLHRDIKPANVLITADGSPRLADFNIGFASKVAGATPAAYFGGTVAYMSPEQLEACNPNHDRTPESLDGRSDLYGLAVVLWELLTGSRPFTDERLDAGWGATLDGMTARRRAGVDRELAASVSGGWPPGLCDALLACLDPDVENRPASGSELARRLELCLAPKAHTLLAPPPNNWRRLARRFPVTAVMLAAVLPNALAAVFNYFYNRLEIIAHLQNSQKAFEQIQATINAIAFPLGIFLVFWFTRPVAAAVRRSIVGRAAGRPFRAVTGDGPEGPSCNRPPASDPPPADVLRQLRRQCLRLGHLAAGICLALWLIAAPVYPIALTMEVGSIPASADVHFVASLTLCGLIAAAYPFFGVACLSVCSFYPALLRIDTMTEEDRRPLVRLAHTSGLYLFLAATVPMLSVAILVLIGSQARVELALLAAAGLAGFGLAFLAYRMLQSDLDALAGIAAPPRDESDSTSALSRSF